MNISKYLYTYKYFYSLYKGKKKVKVREIKFWEEACASSEPYTDQDDNDDDNDEEVTIRIYLTNWIIR